MLQEISTPEFITGIIAILGGVVLILKRLNLIHFGKPEPAAQEIPSCPDQGCKKELEAQLACKLDRDPETGGAHFLSKEVRSKLMLFRPSELQDSMCATNMEKLRREFERSVNKAIRESEQRIIEAVKSNGRG